MERDECEQVYAMVFSCRRAGKNGLFWCEDKAGCDVLLAGGYEGGHFVSGCPLRRNGCYAAGKNNTCGTGRMYGNRSAEYICDGTGILQADVSGSGFAGVSGIREQ